MRIRIRKICKALEEDAFRPVLHHYDGPKFRLELSIAEVYSCCSHGLSMLLCDMLLSHANAMTAISRGTVEALLQFMLLAMIIIIVCCLGLILLLTCPIMF